MILKHKIEDGQKGDISARNDGDSVHYKLYEVSY